MIKNTDCQHATKLTGECLKCGQYIDTAATGARTVERKAVSTRTLGKRMAERVYAEMQAKAVAGARTAERGTATTLTRHDWNGQFDSIKWALETHVGMQDHCEYNFAVLYGNEDCPEAISFFASENPNYTDIPDLNWKA